MHQGGPARERFAGSELSPTEPRELAAERRQARDASVPATLRQDARTLWDRVGERHGTRVSPNLPGYRRLGADQSPGCAPPTPSSQQIAALADQT